MMKKIGLAALTAVVLFLGYVAMQPADYAVSRSIVINAPADRIFPLMSNSKAAEAWGPWLAMDPDTRMTYSGPESGVGSKASWTGGKRMGTGSATIVEMVPNERVTLRLEYTEPMGMTQTSDYLLASQGGQTQVTWRVTGKNSFVGRLMCVFVNMDKMVGGMFETGLGSLKNLVEKGAK